MKAIKNSCKRMTRVVFNFFREVFKWVVNILQRRAFALPHDEVEKLQVLEFIYKTLTFLLILTVLVSGIWLSDRGYPSWPVLFLFALRLLYALPAKRVERALRTHQYQDRERARMMRRP